MIRVMVVSALLACLAQEKSEKEIRGKAVDSDQKPVAGAVVGAMPGLKSGKWVSGRTAWTAGEDGAFTGKLTWTGRPMSLFASDKDGKRGAFFTLDAKNVDTEITITLRPFVAVTGKIDLSAFKKPPRVSYTLRSKAGGILSSLTPDEAFTIPLPPGDYVLSTFAMEAERLDKPFTVGAEPVDLGTIAFKPGPLEAYWGKEPPAITVSEARGVTKDVKLSDFKGKWVLVEFWGYW